MRVLLALGGNAMTSPDGRARSEDQIAAAAVAMAEVAELVARDVEVVITHGNGPQVGNLLIQNALAAKTVAPMPMDVCGAESQGQIGYMAAQTITTGGMFGFVTSAQQIFVDVFDEEAVDAVGDARGVRLGADAPVSDSAWGALFRALDLPPRYLFAFAFVVVYVGSGWFFPDWQWSAELRRDARHDPQEVIVHGLVHADQILLFVIVFGAQDFVDNISFTGQEDQPFAVFVQSAYGVNVWGKSTERGQCGPLAGKLCQNPKGFVNNKVSGQNGNFLATAANAIKV